MREMYTMLNAQVFDREWDRERIVLVALGAIILMVAEAVDLTYSCRLK
jgi:hypothetical protein